MSSTRVEWFLAAKRTLRLHRDWTDEQVGAIPSSEFDSVIRPARAEVEQDE
jgi:hypothetical protein